MLEGWSSEASYGSRTIRFASISARMSRSESSTRPTYSPPATGCQGRATQNGAMAFHRYVALGDSFTEGVGDPDPARPNGLRGWADRVAEVLAEEVPDLGYANLAIRGRKLRQVIEEQVEPALALGPDLVSIHAGGNDVLRPRVDLDGLAAAYDEAVGRLTGGGAHVVMFTIFDPGGSGLYAAMRGRMAIFNEHAREISERHWASLVDMWRMTPRNADSAMTALMDGDRMHLNPVGH